MSRNTKEISLMQVRQGNLSELPKALHQGEIGLAHDANRLFIGNADNNILANRNEFPYQNLEILTEFSDLSSFLNYVYENNILSVNGIENRSEYKESFPIVINCSISDPTIINEVYFSINDYKIRIYPEKTSLEIIDIINTYSKNTNVFATRLQGTNFITLISFTSQLTIEDIEGNFTEVIGFPSVSNTSNISLPEKLISEKLNDILLLSDFGIVSDGTTNESKNIFNALCEIYKNGDDSQFYRKVELQAGTYLFEKDYTDNEINGNYELIEYPIPLISNLRLSGQGIDRTILYSQEYLNPFLNCFNKNLSISSDQMYDTAETPSNIIIEDMTINSSVLNVCILNGVSNVTFNRVKFIGSDYSTLVTIDSNTFDNMSNNIVFNECVFENARNAIIVSKNAKNIQIKGCLFKNISREAIIFGSDLSESEYSVLNSTVSNCSFEDCCKLLSSGSVIKCNNITKYISVINNKFDEHVYNRDTVIPYESLSSYNFCDTLNPNTDRNKFLRFNGVQPVWDYVHGTYDDNLDPNISFKTVNENMEIKSLVNGDTTLFNNSSSDIIIGKSLDGSEESGNIIIEKDLDLNGKNIKSNSDITVGLDNNKILKLDTSKNTTNYEYLIVNEKDAIPNVAFVKNIGKHSILKSVKYNALDVMEGTTIPLVYFDPIVYGNDMHITRVSINVIKPFLELKKENAIDYNVGLEFERGDLVTDKTNYYVVINGHEVSADDDLSLSQDVIMVDIDDTAKSVEYIDIFGNSANGKVYDISNVYTPAYLTSGNNFVSGVSIQKSDKHGLDGCSKFVNGNSYSNNSYIEFNGIIFKTDYIDGSTTKVLSKEDLFNPNITERCYTEGYNYIFDLEKELFNMIENRLDKNSTLLNWSDGKLFLRLLDKDRNPLSNVSKGQFNPGGEVIVRIDMIKHDEIVTPSTDSYTFTINCSEEDATVKMTVNGVSTTTNSINVLFGTTVQYEVSKPGFDTVSGSIKIYKDETLNISLEKSIDLSSYEYTIDSGTVTLNKYIGSDVNVKVPEV